MSGGLQGPANLAGLGVEGTVAGGRGEAGTPGKGGRRGGIACIPGCAHGRVHALTLLPNPAPPRPAVSFFEKAGNAYFNSLVVIDADGKVLGLYRKSHIPDGPGCDC